MLQRKGPYVDTQDLEALTKSLAGRRVVVLGDLVADEYVYGVTSRISREAPVLVVRYSGNAYKLGGGANAAHNVQVLGATAVPIGVLGKDEPGDRVLDILKDNGMSTSGVVRSGRPTTLKTRILAGSVHTTKQQVLRLDREDSTPFDAKTEDALIKALDAAMQKADALLVSDYGLGVLSKRLIAAVQAHSKLGRIVCVDSRYNLRAYVGVTAVTPNEPEAEAAAMRGLESDDSVRDAGAVLMGVLKAKAVVITRGKRGMAVFERRKQPVFIPVVGSDEVSDVTGAGDTVIATFTLALSAGASFTDAARLANVAAGVTVMKAGAATVTPDELVRAIRHA